MIAGQFVFPVDDVNHEYALLLKSLHHIAPALASNSETITRYSWAGSRCEPDKMKTNYPAEWITVDF